ncbi:MAG: FtsX-like permease family protein [Chlamydiia bacterium]|nr:FtsX-like permease family protein [Chlamydiia bacterium]
MWYELSVALKYLLPRRKQLSVSVISLISTIVIALVVWLILVFFSVTNGLEKNWIDKIITLTAPIRAVPTDAYESSYYAQVDAVSQASDFRLKSLREKRLSSISDPYDPEVDPEIPAEWPDPIFNADGSVKDLVRELFEAIDSVGASGSDYQTGYAQVRVHLDKQPGSTITQTVLLSSLEDNHPTFSHVVLPPTPRDLHHLYTLGKPLPMELERVRTPVDGWEIPKNILPKKGSLFVCREQEGCVVPTGPLPADLTVETLSWEGSPRDTLILAGDTSLHVRQNGQQVFVDDRVQDIALAGPIDLNTVEIERATVPKDAYPTFPLANDRVLLPKGFREAGVMIGDRATLSYSSLTGSAMQEMRLPVIVEGFFDPGILPAGGRLVIGSPELIQMVRTSGQSPTQGAGINIRFATVSETDTIRDKLQRALDERGLSPYWKLETFREFDFTKDLLQQMQSDKALFMLIATLIILVACSNIISMLIILVNDKKKEIGILRSMGATSLSIATIFGLCGLAMGLVGSLAGFVMSLFTLNHIEMISQGLSAIQGHNAFNPLFYGDTLPNQLSVEALLFVVAATTAVSLIAGLVPAIKAVTVRPSTILRAP